ncbi:endocuticle structural glycoprotein SgAbd-2-like [Haematobia irritans]|uniref:endocuticle structural glycoprotein SgAbd-2-like n=1 Tax=Haematobia irritans TaxID=7368 RepID=UPI003F4F85E5
MLRATTWTAIILVCGLIHVATAATSNVVTRNPRKTTTRTTPQPVVSDEKYYHPAEVTNPRVLEQVDRRYKDGNFEYKYVLSNGVSRHEKSYWTPAGESRALARKGYYSYPLPNGKYMTVFYTSDVNGFHQDSTTYSDRAPVLPRNLDVPTHTFPEEPKKSTTTTRMPKSKRPTRRPVASNNGKYSS